jgi:hypothetical protein
VSYDLYFPGEIDLDAVRDYLADHGHEVGDAEAGYRNEATGVYWSFSFRGDDDDDDDDGDDGDDDDSAQSSLAFNLNYVRPHVFGLEAERFLSRFVQTLELAVEDPQGGMSDRRYSPDDFLRGWNSSNALAHRMIASHGGGKRPMTLPAARNTAIWRWNYVKDLIGEALMDLAGEVPPCFSPTVMMIVPNGEAAVKTCVIWDLDMAVMIPEVDLVVSGTDDGLVAARRSDVIALLARHSQWRPEHRVDQRPIGMTVDLFDQTPAHVQARLRQLMRPLEAARIATDHVLDEELVAEAFAAQSR